LVVRVSPALMARLEQLAERMSVPGLRLTLSDAARMAIEAGAPLLEQPASFKSAEVVPPFGKTPPARKKSRRRKG
jgi:hypothetical protein